MNDIPLGHWNYASRFLNAEEISDPMRVLYELFDYAHLPELQNALWDWLKTTVSGNFNRKTLHYKDRESLLAFFEKLQKLLEAAHLLLPGNKTALPVDTLYPAGTSPSHPPDTFFITQDGSMEPMVQRMVNLLSPEWVFRMGRIQEANDRLPIHFFLLVLPNQMARPYADCQALIERACPESGTIRLWMIKAVEMTRHLEEGHPLYARLCTIENLLYAADSNTLPVPDEQTIKSRLATASTLLHSILPIARAFYEGAQFYESNANHRLALFMLQQAAEHCLRGCLQAITGRNYVGHNILLLRFHALPFFPDLIHILPVGPTQEDCLLYLLGKAYTKARYQPHFAVQTTQVAKLNEWIQNLLQATPLAFARWVEQVLP